MAANIKVVKCENCGDEFEIKDQLAAKKSWEESGKPTDKQGNPILHCMKCSRRGTFPGRKGIIEK